MKNEQFSSNAKLGYPSLLKQIWITIAKKLYFECIASRAMLNAVNWLWQDWKIWYCNKGVFCVKIVKIGTYIYISGDTFLVHSSDVKRLPLLKILHVNFKKSVGFSQLIGTAMRICRPSGYQSQIPLRTSRSHNDIPMVQTRDREPVAQVVRRWLDVRGALGSKPTGVHP